MKKLLFLMLLMLAVTLLGCSGNRAAEIFETAKFEELQNNREHASKLYREIIEKYPGSEEAAKAQKRLAELQAGK